MLTPMDDTLWHQLPTTFDHVGTSDPRFFDRYWFAATDPAGSGTLQLTLGAYQNMNVIDGGFIAIDAATGKQHNVRASRSLRPHYRAACGPLRVEVLEPLERFRLVVEPGAHGAAGELEWRGVLPAQEELPRFTRVRGRVVEESRRFDQIGECSGWLELAGKRLSVDRWWATRDHSWGVRENMGIEEPVTGAPRAPSSGALFAFLFFSTKTHGGHLQVAQFEGRPDFLTAEIAHRDRPDQDVVHLASAALRVAFCDGARPRRFTTATFATRLANGDELAIETTALGPAVDMQGLGYSGGYGDGRGLGVWRGDDHLEHDVWDVSHPAEVVRGDGTTLRPIHRIQPVRVALRGAGLDGDGTGSLTLIAEGKLPQLGLD
jgi:hypothetical protein